MIGFSNVADILMLQLSASVGESVRGLLYMDDGSGLRKDSSHEPADFRLHNIIEIVTWL